MELRALAAALAVLPAAAAKADDATGVASSRMSYSRFLEYLEMGRVQKVWWSALLKLSPFFDALIFFKVSSAKQEGGDFVEIVLKIDSKRTCK